MAMGQGEQRAIHPFFRKDNGVALPPIAPLPVNDNLHTPNGAILSSGSQPIHSVAALDHDPNIDRRKRRKTDRDVPDMLGNGHTATDEGTPHLEASHSGVARGAGTDAGTQEECESANGREAPPETMEGRSEQPAIQTISSEANEGSEKKRKVVKLNANGKLLSSPVANKFLDKPKAKGKREKSGANQTKDRGQKIVVIKYSACQEFVEDLGKEIDDILAGRKQHFRRAVSRIVAPAAPKVVLNDQPTKATHPFFMKKAAPKSDISNSNSQAPSPTPTPSAHDMIKKGSTHARPVSKPLLSFKHAFSRVPEPIQPLWPPFGLSHVRGTPQNLGLAHDSHYISVDRRKSKTPAVRISDEESVISCTTGTINCIERVLRVPEKQVAGGRVLQETISKKLAKAPIDHNDDASHNESLHPAIRSLYSSLATSMTAFDCGGYEMQLWAHKYAPESAQQVLCATKEALMLRDWLSHLIISSVETGASSKDTEKTKKKEEKKRKRRKKADKLDGFIVDSDGEASEMGEIIGSDDELAGDVTTSIKRTVIRTGDLTINVRAGTERSRMANTILVSGPSGCGKTASVYAVAKEMGFEVFELNSGSRRSAKDILDRLGDMTQNHLVHSVHTNANPASDQASTTDTQPSDDAKQNKLLGFFKSTASGATKRLSKGRGKEPLEPDAKHARSQKQSLILLEEVDILFEEDKQFWTGVLALINQSKRPIIMTCNDESLIPFDDISFHAILRYRAPPQDLAVDYLLLMAASEGHVLDRAPVEKLYRSTNSDLRKSIMDLNYWCQIAVGSEKAGLDWLIDRWPQGADLDSNGDKLRVLSRETYRDYMGWLSRDVLISNEPWSTSELQEETLYWWNLSLQDADSTEGPRYKYLATPNLETSKLELHDNLRYQSDHLELRSVLDVLATPCCLDAQKDAIDNSIPPLPEKQKLNYIEGYRLLSADRISDYSALTAEIGSSFEVLLESSFQKPHETDPDTETILAAKVLAAKSQPKTVYQSEIELCEALVPIMKPSCATTPLSGRSKFSFEHSLRHFAEELAPYVRAIVAFDLRLEQYRLELSRLLSGNGRGTKRVRTTRASRAALEGGSKSETRKERWFPPGTNVARVLATGKREWQDLLLQNGHFSVPAAGEQQAREDSEPVSESASDIS